MKKEYKIDETKLTPEQRKELESYNDQQKQLQTLQDIADIVQELVHVTDDTKKVQKLQLDKLGAVMTDAREQMKKLADKEDPETPDFSKPVVEAVGKLEKAIKAIKQPDVNVSSPEVHVDAPDLSEIKKALDTMPKAFEKAIALIPKVEIPKTDNSQLLEAWEGISEQLLSIEAGVRMKPLPGSMTISNLNEVTEVIQTPTAYKTKIDKSSTTNVIYIGEAAIGSATSDNVWKITKIDKTVTDNVTITYRNAGAFSNIWDDRLTGSYS